MNLKKNIIYIFILLTLDIIIFLSGFYNVLLKYINISLLTILFITINLLLYFFLTTNQIINSKKKLENILNKIKQTSGDYSDLVQRLPVESNDKIGQISKNFNIFIAKIHNIIFKVKNVSKETKNISQELKASSYETATALEEFVATIKSIEEREQLLDNNVNRAQNNSEEIRNAIIKIVNRIKDQNDDLDQSKSVIDKTIASINNLNVISGKKKDQILKLSEFIKKSEEDMKQTIDSINEISESAQVIDNLIRVINELNIQTNMLSMNAAIEAAHAGDAGRGFAVVADEIKKLSETTTNKSKDISSYLKNIITKIQQSSQLTEKTNISFKTMINDILDVSQSMADIITNLREISNDTSQITSSLNILFDTSKEIYNDSKIIDEKSEIINTLMKDVLSLSNQSTNSIKELNLGIQEIKTSTDYIFNSVNKNSENIKIIDQEIEKFNIIDTSKLKSSDGQPLILWNKKEKIIPKRPDNPKKYPETDERHWYDMEYAGWGVIKTNIPKSNVDGSKGKTIILLQFCDHPYHISYRLGCKKICDTFGINLISYQAKYSVEIQEKQVDKAIKQKPDLIIISPIDEKACVDWFKKINQANIPLICSNTLPDNEGFKYILSWTGPDDWAQFRLLAKKFAELMNKKGGYCILRHVPGNSNYYSRTYSILTELIKIAPEMKCLDMQPAIEKNEAKKIVLKWIEKFGNNLNGIVFSDPADGSIGLCEAIHEKNREDIIRVSSGNSKITQDLVKEGKLHAITFQSAESDGAIAVETAIDWFNGLDIASVKYLPMGIITKENVEHYYPAQW